MVSSIRRFVFSMIGLKIDKICLRSSFLPSKKQNRSTDPGAQRRDLKNDQLGVLDVQSNSFPPFSRHFFTNSPTRSLSKSEFLTSPVASANRSTIWLTLASASDTPLYFLTKLLKSSADTASIGIISRINKDGIRARNRASIERLLASSS